MEEGLQVGMPINHPPSKHPVWPKSPRRTTTLPSSQKYDFVTLARGNHSPRGAGNRGTFEIRGDFCRATSVRTSIGPVARVSIAWATPVLREDVATPSRAG